MHHQVLQEARSVVQDHHVLAFWFYNELHKLLIAKEPCTCSLFAELSEGKNSRGSAALRKISHMLTSRCSVICCSRNKTTLSLLKNSKTCNPTSAWAAACFQVSAETGRLWRVQHYQDRKEWENHPFIAEAFAQWNALCLKVFNSPLVGGERMKFMYLVLTCGYCKQRRAHCWTPLEKTMSKARAAEKVKLQRRL